MNDKKRKLTFYLVYLFLLAVLFAILWGNSSASARQIIQNALYIIPKIFNAVSLWVWLSLAIIIVLVMMDGLYNRYQREKQLQERRQAHATPPPAPIATPLHPTPQPKKYKIPDNPIRRAEWIETYPIIKPMRRTMTWTQISAQIESNYPHLPHSEDTLTEIFKAGEDGALSG